jgi:hypothetical protein
MTETALIITCKVSFFENKQNKVSKNKAIPTIKLKNILNKLFKTKLILLIIINNNFNNFKYIKITIILP